MMYGIEKFSFCGPATSSSEWRFFWSALISGPSCTVDQVMP